MVQVAPLLTVLDGPMGTELDARGADTRLPLWSARALFERPETVSAIHRDFARAGATVHTTNTFRARRRTLGARWEEGARLAVALARGAVPNDHRVAGGIAPLEDCYRPDLSPEHAEDEHRELAEVLADAGCDLLLCETFTHPREALDAVRAAVRTGRETWLALSAGPDASLMSPSTMADAARAATDLGAQAILVNCVGVLQIDVYVGALIAAVGARVPVGAYANAGHADDRIGWTADRTLGGARYAEHARAWIDEGATIVGACCGTGPEHVAALAALRDG